MQKFPYRGHIWKACKFLLINFLIVVKDYNSPDNLTIALVASKLILNDQDTFQKSKPVITEINNQIKILRKMSMMSTHVLTWLMSHWIKQFTGWKNINVMSFFPPWNFGHFNWWHFLSRFVLSTISPTSSTH